MRLYMPTKVFFGSGCVSENGAELKALGSRAMIVTGKHSSRINGSLAAVEQRQAELPEDFFRLAGRQILIHGASPPARMQ